MTTATQVSDYASQIITAIRSDITAGLVPATARSFAALHDYVDANGYVLGLFPDWDSESDEQAALDNAIMDEADTRIRHGALLDGDEAQYADGFATGIEEARQEDGPLPSTPVRRGKPATWNAGYRAGRSGVRSERHNAARLA